ncbi:MAG: hypothetical protein M0Z67_03945 [Nitrospiraceae bacterium]|nr:hypothetical protein [Nitrospiraceae bacterium]
MIMNTIGTNQTTGTGQTSGTSQTSGISQTLGKEDFLKLFTEQLKYQDPLNPLDSTQFTAQLAQFSSLEQLVNVNTGLQQMTQAQNTMNGAVSAALIGRHVKTAAGDAGAVTGVTFSNGVTYLATDTAATVSLADVTEIY